MVKVFPFNALVPNAEFVQMVAAQSTGVESTEELLAQMESNPFSYLHVVKPYLHFNEPKHPEKHFPFARNYFKQMQEQKILKKSVNPSSFIYDQTHNGITFSGVVTGVSVNDYFQGKVKKHENTRTLKEEKLVKHVETIGAVGEPVLLSLPGEDTLSPWMQKNRTDLLFSFTDDTGKTHKVWKVENPLALNELSEIFATVDSLYIADGHHRIAASSSYISKLGWDDERAVFMSYILPESALGIKSFHRLLHGFDNELLQKLPLSLKDDFNIIECEHGVVPQHKYQFGMYCNKLWYLLELKNAASTNNAAEDLGVKRLEHLVFEKVLGITDTKSDERIGFMKGDTPLVELEKGVERGEYQLAFTLYPNSMLEVKAVADAGLTMPPKSTWIEPKLLTGMIIQTFHS